MKRRVATLAALLLLAVVAAAGVVGADSGAADALPAPTVQLSAATGGCDSNKPHTYLLARYTAVAGAESYQFRVKWSRTDDFPRRWVTVQAGKPPGKFFALDLSRSIAPGEVYAVQLRAVDGSGNKGETGSAQYTLTPSDFPAPAGALAAYTSPERTAARITWQGDARSKGWFSVQKRPVGKKWRSNTWQRASRVDGDDNASPYYRDVSGLDPLRAYQFRVTGYTGQCGAGSWSDPVGLWPVLESGPSDALHEADGRWRQHDGGPLSLRVSADGRVIVKWKKWVGPVEVDLGEGQSETRYVRDWRVTLTKPDSRTVVKDTGTAGQRIVAFGNTTIGLNYGVAVEALDSEGRQLGEGQSAVVRPRHVSAPEPVTGLTLSVGGDNLSVAADWTAPASGGTPKRYVVYLTNLDTGHTRLQVIDAGHRGRSQWTLPKTEASFDRLWPGDTYRVSVQTSNRDTRSGVGQDHHKGWQHTGWVSETITMPAGDEPDYDKVVPTLTWARVWAGETAPPYAVGEPTDYIILVTPKDIREGNVDGPVPGGLAWFDFPNRCNEYQSNARHFNDKRAGKNEEFQGGKVVVLAAGNQDRLDAHKLRRDAVGEEKYIARLKSELADLIAAKDAETNAAQIQYYEQRIAHKRAEIAVSDNLLATMKTDLAVKCLAGYPVDENLGQDDNRYYRVSLEAFLGEVE